MKICWDNLEKLRYNKKKGCWYGNTGKSRNKYMYEEKCKNCGQPFLAKEHAIFCCLSCGNSGKNNPSYGLPRSNEIKNKIRKSLNGPKGPNWKGGISKLGISLYNTYAHKIKWCEQVRRDPDNLDWLQVKCSYCRKWYNPTFSAVNNRIQSLNGNYLGDHNLYCSEECKNLCPIFRKILYRDGDISDNRRDPDYNIWSEMVKERDDYTCQRCGSTDRPEAHHFEGLNENDMMSLDLEMGITLCHDHHKDAHKELGCRYADLQKRNICRSEG